MYVLDTDVSIEYLRGIEEVKDKLTKLNRLFITTISLAELLFGIYNSKNVGKHYSKLMDFLAGVKILNFDFAACNLFGKLKSDLKIKGKFIGDFDTMIAAVTIDNGFTLITKNIKHYKSIKDLKMANFDALE